MRADNYKYFVLSLCLIATSALAQDMLKIGFVNAAKILDQAPQAEQARERLQKQFEARDKALVDAQRALRELEDKLADEGPALAEETRRKLMREISTQKRDVARMREEFTEDFNLARNDELAKLQRLVYDAIIALAKEENFDLIVNDGAVIYASERADITDKVLGRLQ